MLALATSILVYSQNSQTINLNSDWQFSEAGKNEWKEALIPGSVQRDLIRLGELPDPYFGTNENKVQGPEDKNWDYRKSFTVTDENLASDDALLSFEGLDTYADVFLNGARILQTENMFVGYKVSIKNILHKGENELFIRFYSPINYTEPQRLSAGFEYPADNDHRKERASVYSRKAPYHFGWDWGMRLVQMGIWRPVNLTFYNKARIDDYFVQQISVTEQTAKINNQIEVFSVSNEAVNAEISVKYGLRNENKQAVLKNITLLKGENTIKIPLEINKPKRWMPAGWGEQYLYDFTTQVTVGGKLIAEKSHKIGLRTIEMVRENDEKGRSFYFRVNDIPCFAKGANYIPGEIMNTKQDKAYYDRLFDNVTEANMNMLRVWGGGTYEDDYFYQLADEKGILIWQEFMFACTVYPSDDAFLKNISKEAEYNIKRLRNYACISLWSGNNEVWEALNHWGWDKKYTPEQMNNFRTGYDKIFKQVLPSKIKELDPDKYYMHSSPDTANWGKTETLSLGDSHYWGLWHGREPFEVLNEKIPRFMSEFGFQSFPEMKTIRSFATEADRNINSDVMKIHQKSGIGNDVIKQYMKIYYQTPKNFDDFVYVGLVMQGQGMREGIESHRRNQPYCMGTLYWQLNDDWPVVSWSSVDYYNNWKAQHYKARDVFAPIALGTELKDNKLSYFTMSDKLEDASNLKLNVQVIDFAGKKIKSFTETVTAKANTSNKIRTYDVADLLTEDQKHNCVVHAWLSDKDGKTVSVKNYYFYWPIKLNLPETTINITVKKEDGKYTVTLSSNMLAKDVFVEIPIQGAKFSDNFFDLLPGEKKTITISSPELKKAGKTIIRVKHLRETYK